MDETGTRFAAREGHSSILQLVLAGWRVTLRHRDSHSDEMWDLSIKK